MDRADQEDTLLSYCSVLIKDVVVAETENCGERSFAL